MDIPSPFALQFRTIDRVSTMRNEVGSNDVQFQTSNLRLYKYPMRVTVISCGAAVSLSVFVASLPRLVTLACLCQDSKSTLLLQGIAPAGSTTPLCLVSESAPTGKKLVGGPSSIAHRPPLIIHAFEERVRCGGISS